MKTTSIERNVKQFKKKYYIVLHINIILQSNLPINHGTARYVSNEGN